MHKKLIAACAALMVSATACAQFEQGKAYVGASLSSLNLSYSGSEKGSFGIQAKGGYLFDDDWMVTGQVEYDKTHDVSANFKAGVGARYYIEQNGLFLSATVDYLHVGSTYDDFMPGVSIGYAFFLSRTVTVEPEIYYRQSFKNHSDYSTVGFRVGLGVYL